MANIFNYKSKSFSIGDTIQVFQNVKEGDKQRSQMFEGILIAIKGRAKNQSFTVRKIAAGSIGVERIWPVYTPTIIDIKKKKAGQVRRSKLYYLRDRTGKQAKKVKEKIPIVSKTATKSANEVKKTRTKSRKPRKKTASK